MQIGDTLKLSDAVITEVSVLTPATKPAEPFAKVLLVREESPTRPVRATPGPAAGEIIHGGERIVRPGIGQVLAVR